MSTFSLPSQGEADKWFLSLLFDTESSFLSGAVRLAYSDFQRTLSGIGNHPEADALRKQGHDFVENAIKKIADRAPSQSAFDQWHNGACHDLRKLYRDALFEGFTFGHAQKWINMTVKYIALLGDRAVSGGRALLDCGHVPIDGYILSAFRRQQYLRPVPPFEPWSKKDSYEEYMNFQIWIRSEFPDSKPLAVEFFLWKDEAARERRPKE